MGLVLGVGLGLGLGLGLALLGRTTAALLVALQAPGLMSCCCAPAQRAWHELLYVLPLAHTGMYSMVQMQPCAVAPQANSTKMTVLTMTPCQDAIFAVFDGTADPTLIE